MDTIMSIWDTKKLIEEKKVAVDALQHLVVKVKNESRAMNAEEKQKYDELTTVVTDCTEKIDTSVRMDKAAVLTENQEVRVNVTGNKPRCPESLITNKDREYALRGFLINNHPQAEKYQRREFVEAAEKIGLDLNKKEYTFDIRYAPFWYPKELRTFAGQGDGTWNQGSTVGTTGGFLTDQSLLLKELEVFTKWHSGMYMASKVLQTPESGSYLYKPTLDDTANSASVHTELSQMDGLDAAFQHATIPAFVFDSIVMASIELIQDAKLPIEEILAAEVLGVRIARKENTDYTVGSGSGTVTGLKTAVHNASHDFTSASAGTFTYNDLVTAIYNLDWSYIVDQSFAIMLSQTAYANFWGLTDSQNRPLMNMSMDAIAPRDRLLGHPVIINNDFDTFAAGNTVGCMGAFRCSNIRNVGGLNIRVLNERFIYDNLAVGIAAWKRAGYCCVNTSAFRNLKVHA